VKHGIAPAYPAVDAMPVVDPMMTEATQ